jgi:hypothetical protein
MFIISRFVSVSVLSLWVSLLSMTCSGGPKDKLQVWSIGLGTLVPNYSNADLQIGANYKMTAIARPGNRFQEWIVATNWEGGMVRTTPDLTFTMQSNLTITAMFADINPPVVRMLNLAPRQKVAIPVFSNAVFTVKGTSQDNVGVSNVWYRLNGGPWTRASGTTAWESPLALSQQANLFQVFAEDAAGNHSPVSSVSFFYVAIDHLALATEGGGQIFRFFTGDLLELGRFYSVRAVPDAGQLFYGWSGTISGTRNPLSFTMQSNMTLQATFIANPFPNLKGDYKGLFYPGDPGHIDFTADTTNCGCFALKLTTNGYFSGQVRLAEASLPFSGAFNPDLQAQVNVPQSGRRPLEIYLQLDRDLGAITGSVGQDQQWSSSLWARRTAAGTTNQFAGTYTLLLEGCDTGGCFLGPPVPMGDSPATVKVSRTGGIQLNGTLADGTVISQGATVLDDGSWPLYIAPYGGGGVVLGWLDFSGYGGTDALLWQKPPVVAGEHYYTNGFWSVRIPSLTRYLPPAAGQNAVDWTNGTLQISSGALPGPLTNQVSLVNNQVRVQGGTISNLAMTITPSDGSFKGSFVHPVTGKTNTFRGVLQQNPPSYLSVVSGGWFLGPGGAGGNLRGWAISQTGPAGPAQLLEPQILMDGDAPLAPGTTAHGYAIPCMTDWNGDGKKDLLVGYQTNGNIALYLNVGTDDQPQFAGFTNLKTADGNDICHPSPGCGSPCPWFAISMATGGAICCLGTAPMAQSGSIATLVPMPFRYWPPGSSSGLAPTCWWPGRGLKPRPAARALVAAGCAASERLGTVVGRIRTGPDRRSVKGGIAALGDSWAQFAGRLD